MTDTLTLTFRDLADRLGITQGAARKRVARAGWRTFPGNDGKTRIVIPLDALTAPASPVSVTPDPPVSAPSRCPSNETRETDVSTLVAALERERDRLIARLDAAEKEAREARGEAIEARIKLADALARLDERERLVRALEGRGWLGRILG